MQYVGLAWVVLQAIYGRIGVGDFVLLAGALAMVRLRLAGLLSALGDINEHSLFFSSLTDFLDVRPRITPPANPKPLPAKLARGLVFDEVSFSYPGSRRKVFDRLSLTLRAGESTALVGPNGAGKTTLVKLITRLYDPGEGRILLDGVDIREYDPDDYRTLIATVLQDFARYHLSAADNISLGKVQAPPDLGLVQRAAEKAGALEIIERLPEEWFTILRVYPKSSQSLVGLVNEEGPKGQKTKLDQSNGIAKKYQISHEQWQVMQPCLPPAKIKLKAGRPRMEDRKAMTAILYVRNSALNEPGLVHPRL